jgi:hypothetical protein
MSTDQWDGLSELIEFNGDYLNWSVSELLELAGARRAGARVVEDIERELAARNIGHLPPHIPRDGTCRVLLYTWKRGVLGPILHLVRQVAAGETSDGKRVDVDINALAMLLGTVSPQPPQGEQGHPD